MSNTNMDNICEDYICPITGQIFHEPVSVEDGIIYEKTAILTWLAEHDTSPMTRQKISSNVHLVQLIKNKIEKYLKEHPEYIKHQYVVSKKYKDNKRIIQKIISDKDFNKLLKYEEYMITDTDYKDDYQFNISLIQTLCECCENDDIIMHVLDNCVDLKKKVLFKNVKTAYYPIHVICEYGSPTVIKHVVNKGVKLNLKTNDGHNALHILCRYSDIECISLAINCGADINAINKYGKTPVHDVCKYGDICSIELLSTLSANFHKLDNKKKSVFDLSIKTQCANTLLSMMNICFEKHGYSSDKKKFAINFYKKPLTIIIEELNNNKNLSEIDRIIVLKTMLKYKIIIFHQYIDES